MKDFLYETLNATWLTTTEMAPYLLFGFAAAGLLSLFLSPERVESHLGGHGPWPVIKAALLGIPLPLCSCSVIPVAATLRRHGATRGATTAFLISTPQTGVDSILVTYGLLGPVVAIVRPIAALVSGLIGGFLVGRQGTDPAKKETAQEDCCCEAASAESPALVRALRHAFQTLPSDIGRPMLLGLLTAGLINALIPPDYFAATIGTGIGAMLVMMALGIPLYVCATASVPIAAALILKGVPPGAALVFLMTGPATNAATFTTLWKLLGIRSALTYLLTVAGTALLAGWALNSIIAVSEIHLPCMDHDMAPSPLRVASAVVLLLLLGLPLLRRPGRTRLPNQA